MKNLQHNNPTIGAQEFPLVDKAAEDIYIYNPVYELTFHAGSWNGYDGLITVGAISSNAINFEDIPFGISLNEFLKIRDVKIYTPSSRVVITEWNSRRDGTGVTVDLDMVITKDNPLPFGDIYAILSERE